MEVEDEKWRLEVEDKEKMEVGNGKMKVGCWR